MVSLGEGAEVSWGQSNSSFFTQTLMEFLGIPGNLDGFCSRQGKMCQKVDVKADLEVST